jgi:hypothetical protein
MGAEGELIRRAAGSSTDGVQEDDAEPYQALAFLLIETAKQDQRLHWPART